MSPTPIVAALASRRNRSIAAAVRLYALSNLSPSNYFATQAGGGEAGVSTGFFEAVLVRADAVTFAAIQMVAQRMNNSNQGRQLYVTASGAIYASLADGVGNFYGSPARALTHHDIGRLHALILQHDGTAVRLWVDRVQAGLGTAVSGYTPSSNAHVLGAGYSYAASGLPILAALTGRGVLTQANIEALFDATRTNGDFPSTVAGATVTHRWSLREALAGQTVTDGQAAPASLADTITGATVDVMTKFGAPTVKVIDTSIDGRKSYGLANANGFNYLQSTAGIKGAATGLTWLAAIRVDSVPSASSYLAGTYTTTPAGYAVYGSTGGVINVFRAGQGDLSISTCGTADIGRYKLIGVTHDGATWRTWDNGVVNNTVTASLVHAGSAAMQIGRSPHDAGATVPFATIYGVAGCDVALSSAEMAAVYADWLATGRLRLPSGKTNPHVYDLALDMAADPTAVPAQIQDRAGTDHLTRVGGWAVRNGGLVSGEAASTTTETFAATTGSTAPWTASASGHYVETLAYIESVGNNAGSEMYVCQGRFAGTHGFWLYATNTAPAMLVVGTTGGTVTIAWNGTSGGTVTPGLHHIAYVWTGSQALLYVDGVLRASSATGLTFQPEAATEQLAIGCLRPSAPIYKLLTRTSRGIACGNFVPSAAEIATASSAAIAAGYPVGVPGKHTYRVQIPTDIASAGGVPGVLRDRVADAAPLVVSGSGVLVSRRTERLWSYESTPQQIGARGWSAANYFAGAMTAFGHTALPFWFLYPIIIHSKSGASLNLLGKASSAGTQGFNPYCGTAFASLGMYFGTGSSYAAAPNLTVQDSDLGRPLLMAYQWTGSVLQAFARRARLGGDVTAATYGPYTGTLALGRHSESPLNPLGDQATLLGFMGGLGNISLAEYQAAHDAYFAENDLVAIPGKTLRLYSTKKTSVANSGALATLVDQMGSSESLPIFGAPTVSNTYTHAA